MLCAVGVSLAGFLRVDGAMATLGVATLAFCIFSRIFGEINLRSLALSANFPRRVTVGKPFEVQLTISNRHALFDSFRVNFGVQFLDKAKVEGSILWLGKGRRAFVQQRISVAQRGLRKEQSGVLSSEFPLSLFRFERQIVIERELGVRPKSIYPRKIPSSSGSGGKLVGQSGVLAGEADEWRGFREMQAGDSMKQVIWNQSLRAAANGKPLLVREHEPPGRHTDSCLIVFHSCGGDGKLIRPDRFENAIALYLGLIEKFWREGIRVKCLADFDGWLLRELRNQDDLARVREDLMEAKRASGTEIHELEAKVEASQQQQSVYLVSDISSDRLINPEANEPLKLSSFDISVFDIPRRSLSAN